MMRHVMVTDIELNEDHAFTPGLVSKAGPLEARQKEGPRRSGPRLVLLVAVTRGGTIRGYRDRCGRR